MSFIDNVNDSAMEPCHNSFISNWNTLDDALLAEIFSYCTASELFVLRRVNTIFRYGSRLAVYQAKSLHLSFLLQLSEARQALIKERNSYSNSNSNRNVKKKRPRLSGKKQNSYSEQCVLHLLRDAGDGRFLQRAEFGGLRHITGEHGRWLENTLSYPNISFLDLSGCCKLHPRLLQMAIEESGGTSNLLHLNLQGCARVDASVVMTIARKLPRLESILLGGCSQTIGDACLEALCECLRNLRVLDVSGLKNITDDGARSLWLRSPRLESLNFLACERIRFEFLREHGLTLFRRLIADGDIRTLLESLKSLKNVFTFLDEPFGNQNTIQGWQHLLVLQFSNMGTPRMGLVTGALGVLACFSMGSLREVHVSGCEQIEDWEIDILASTCSDSLTCLEMRACKIGDATLLSLARSCTSLADLDISACFSVSDEGVTALCPYNSFDQHFGLSQGAPESPELDILDAVVRRGCPTLRSLKIASLPRLTDTAILAIGGIHIFRDNYFRSETGGLDKLLLLDVRNCGQVTSCELGKTVLECASLIEVDARETNDTNLHKYLLRTDTTNLKNRPRAKKSCYSLRFVNGRQFQSAHSRTKCISDLCCTVSHQSQRLKASQGVALQMMVHCVDCKLLPLFNRGICCTCASVCHEGHRTFVGSYARFYCDCAYGIAGENKSECKALNNIRL